MVILFWLSQTWAITLRILEYLFSGCTVPPDSKETKVGSSDQEASPSADKNTGVVLVPCLHMEVFPDSYFRWCGYFWGPRVSFVMTDEFSMRVTKITSRIGVSWTHSLPFYFLTYLNLMNYDHIIKSMYTRYCKSMPCSGCSALDGSQFFLKKSLAEKVL